MNQLLGVCVLGVLVAGCGAEALPAPPPRPSPPLLSGAAALAGVVRVGDLPVAGATVCAQDVLSRSLRCVGADVSGAFRIANLAPGGYEVWASAAEAITVESRTAWLRPAESRVDLVLALVPGAVAVRGRVIDRRGRPARATVVARIGDVWASGTVTGVDGAFTVWTRPGDTVVEAFNQANGRSVDRVAAPLEMRELVVPVTALVRGRVTRAGKPVPGASVRGEGASTITAGDGSFQLALATGWQQVVAATYDGYGVSAPVLVRDGSPGEIEVEVRDAAQVRGRIVSAVGVGVEACRLTAPVLELTGRLGTFTGAADASGTVRVEALPPDRYRVGIRCGHVLTKHEPLVVAERDVWGLVWELEPPARVEGRVVERESARPLGGARVSIGRVAATSAPDGSFLLDGLEAGDLALRVTRRGYQNERIRVNTVAGESTVATIDLASARSSVATLAVVVTDERGRQPWGPRVQVSGAGVDAEQTCDPHCHFDRLEPGTYRVTSGVTSREVTVTQDEARFLSLVVPGFRGALTGRLVRPDGKPVSGAEISAVNPGVPLGHDDAFGETDEHGQFRLEGITAAGFVSARASEGQGRIVAPQTASDLQIYVALATRSVTGNVIDSSGVPVRDGSVTASRSGQQEATRTRVFASGRFAFHGLVPGTYTLQVDGDRIETTLVLGSDEDLTGITITAPKPAPAADE